MSEVVKQIVRDYSAQIKDKHIFFQPDIPRKKLRNALTSYAKDAQEQDALVLVDDTVFGSAKDGALLTPTALYTHNQMEQSQRTEISEIETVSLSKGLTRVLYVNDTKILKTNIPEKEAMRQFTEMLREIVKVLHPEETEKIAIQKDRSEQPVRMAQQDEDKRSEVPGQPVADSKIGESPIKAAPAKEAMIGKCAGGSDKIIPKEKELPADSDKFELPTELSLWSVGRPGPSFILECFSCHQELEFTGHDQALSRKSGSGELTSTGKTIKLERPGFVKFAKFLAGALAVGVGVLIGSVLIGIPFIWIFIAAISYCVLQPFCELFVTRLDFGRPVMVWLFQCGKCGKEQFVASSESMVSFTKPKEA